MLIKYALVDFSPVEVTFFQAAIGAAGLLTMVLFQGGSARDQVLSDALGPVSARIATSYI
jgi:hypothetical protein